MGLISTTCASGVIDFPCKDCQLIIEDNIGDRFPVHIHFGKDGRWDIRIHFTYDDFKKLVEGMKKAGRLQ